MSNCILWKAVDVTTHCSIIQSLLRTDTHICLRRDNINFRKKDLVNWMSIMSGSDFYEIEWCGINHIRWTFCRVCGILYLKQCELGKLGLFPAIASFSWWSRTQFVLFTISKRPTPDQVKLQICGAIQYENMVSCFISRIQFKFSIYFPVLTHTKLMLMYGSYDHAFICLESTICEISWSSGTPCVAFKMGLDFPNCC